MKCEQDTHGLGSAAITIAVSMCPVCTAGGAGLDRASFIQKLFPSFECVCTCVWKYACVGVTCGQVCPSRGWRAFLRHCLLFRRVLSLAHNSSSRLDWSLNCAKGPPVSVPTVLRSPEHATKPGFLTWVPGVKLRSSAYKCLIS